MTNETQENNQNKNNNNSNRPQSRPQSRPQNRNNNNQNRGNQNRNSNSNDKNPNKRNYKRNAVVINGELKKNFELNERVQRNRLNPLYKQEQIGSDDKIKITPLGGLGEIGGNILIIENDTCAVIVDVGMSFPDETMHGVDILIPDFTYLREIKDKIQGILITHAHEDHIGAIAYLFKEMQFPIYGTALPLQMISNKFDEHKLQSHKKYFRPVQKRKPVSIGDFKAEWIHITHSIIDSSCLAITTPAGVIFHTGDFKIDHTPIDGYTTDLNRIGYYGEKGILAMLSDSTNSHSPGFTKSEGTVGPTFDKIYSNAKGRVIMSTFSSNLHRVFQAIEHGIKYGRKICVIGRSMEKNLETAMGLGYIDLPLDKFIEANEVGRYSDNEVMIVTTGSQGEAMSALYRMSIGEHRHIKIQEGDQIILSAKAIPGNEASVSGVINNLLKAGADVAYQDFSEIHVSGHAAQEEQKLLIRLAKPKFFLPVHGEYNHVIKHRETAVKCGVDQRNTYILSDGEQVEIGIKSLRKVGRVKTGKVYIDNQLNHKIADDVVMDRQKLSTEGILMIVAQVNEDNGALITKPKVTSFGLVQDGKQKEFLKEIDDLLNIFTTNIKPALLKNSKVFENELRTVVRKHCVRKYKKYPLIVPHVFVM
jgi:ribonuclease J